MKYKKGDLILVTKGKDKGKTGKIDKCLPKINKIVVSGVNVYKKNVKPNRRNPQGGIVDFNSAIYADNVTMICPRCTKTTRVSYKITQKDKLRICKKCKESIDAKA